MVSKSKPQRAQGNTGAHAFVSTDCIRGQSKLLGQKPTISNGKKSARFDIDFKSSALREATNVIFCENVAEGTMSLSESDTWTEQTMRTSKMVSSLVVAAVNVVFVVVAFTLFEFPRFTTIGGLLCVLILLLLIVDVALVLRDFWSPGTRLKAVFAVLLWLPIPFLFLMILQWEGPLYVAVEHSPLHFQVRGLSMFCGLGVYGPEQENPEWVGDDIGLLWKIQHDSGPHPFKADFAYGEIPAGFVQQIPPRKTTASSLVADVNYKLEVSPCMGEPRYFTLHGSTITEYKSNPNVCWGSLKVPERNSTISVRGDCNTLQPLPLSDRAKERLQAYRENRIPFY